MIVYVETNFVLELAFQQETSTEAEKLLTFAESGTIGLAFPAYALGEALWNVVHRANERKSLSLDLRDEHARMARSSSQEAGADTIATAIQSLAIANEAERRLFDTFVDRLLRNASCIPLDTLVSMEAGVMRGRFGLSDQDALILASVLADLRGRDPSEPKWLVSRDRAGFSTPAIRTELRGHGCGVVHSFIDAVRIVERQAA